MTIPNTNQDPKKDAGAPANQNASVASADKANTNTPAASDDQTIWKWKNTAHLTTNSMEVGFAVAAVTIAITAIYSAVTGVAFPLAFLAQPWVIAAIASYAAVYFTARSVSSWQKTYAVEESKGKDGVNGKDGKDGAPGKDADLSALLVLGEKTCKIVKEKGDDNVEQLKLQLSTREYNELTTGLKADEEAIRHVLLAGKLVGVKFKHSQPKSDAQTHEVTLTEVDGKSKEMTKVLGEENLDKDLKIFNLDKPLTTQDIFSVTHLASQSKGKNS